MKSFHNRALLTASATLAMGATLAAYARLPVWMQTVVSGSAMESALYRAMDLPGVGALYARPPAEAREQLNLLVAAKPDGAELYSLRADVEEQNLDFAAAEQDWKLFVTHATDKAQAQFELADYYHRRNLGSEEIAALEAAASGPSSAAEGFLAADRQKAWKAFPRALDVARDQAVGDDATITIYKAWITRYPNEPAAYANFIAAMIQMHRYADAQREIDEYRASFPNDQILPIKATALLAFDQGNADATKRALALFDKAYQPLWPDDLLKTYFALLDATHAEHSMLADTRAALLKDPDDLAAASKLFAYYQQKGHQDAAVAVIAQYAASKDQRHASWSADELYTFANLLERGANPQQAARYYVALSSAQGRISATSQSPEEAGLSGIIHLLLASGDQLVDIGSGNLSIYRDIATLDRGPGYLNGILSLWLNSQAPATEFQGENQKAARYFHRAKAAELLDVFDQRFPSSGSRPALHAELIEAYISYGQDAAVKEATLRFLIDFPHAPQRMQVALELADAYARSQDTREEFDLYDRLLLEQSAELKGMPLSAAGVAGAPTAAAAAADSTDAPAEDAAVTPNAEPLLQQSLTLSVAAPPTTAGAEAYRQVLDRYLGRLTAAGEVPAALVVLRRELDRNPNDPLLYERLADFLQQNNLGAQQEVVYQQALNHFHDTTFYNKLARFYIRQRRDQDFDALTHKVVNIFHGTDLEQYFAAAGRSHPSDPLWPREYLELNLYAHQRFPHDLTFTRNLLFAYRAKGTADPIAREKLLREHFQEASDLQTELFEELVRHHKLADELATLKTLAPGADAKQQNFAATYELAELYLWQSHFEQSAPLLGELARNYPAGMAIGEQAASVHRSLAYLDPEELPRAVEIEEHLYAANPGNANRLATIGDIFANSTASSANMDVAQQLANARPFWRRMSALHPGRPEGYLQAATVFWDYFQFDDALREIQDARRHFNNPALYGYQAGAIYENKRDYLRAITEYVAADLSAGGPGDDGVGEANDRLLALVANPEFTALVDQATAKAASDNPSISSLKLRIAILNILHRQSKVGALVEGAVAHARSIDELTALESLSQTYQLPGAYRSAVARKVELTNDPVQRIEFQYELVRVLVDQKDIPSAQRVIEAVHAENSKLIGVVRTTTDFYWNNKQPQLAIATLVQAARESNAALAHDFTLEAIAKSNQSGDYAGARNLLKPLLAAEPFNPQFLDLEAESYSLVHDDAAVRDLYTATITAINAAPLSATERRDKIALARQGLIPALTDLKDFAGAMDQHTALIHAFPEDANILEGAISYARLHGREVQLVSFFKGAVESSPRDARFAIDLGHVDVEFEDNEGALAAYSKAIGIRADRADLFIARADLEERNQSFDDACADYEHLYKLTYNDPQWMQKVALTRARQGKPDLVVKALQTAWIDGRPDSAQNEFRVAQQLDSWNLLPQAEAFAARGVQLAGKDLLARPENASGAVLYTRVMVRERKARDAFAVLKRVLDASSSSPNAPSVILQQVQKQGIASIGNNEWRAALVASRLAQAKTTFRDSVQAMASVVGEFYMPEEKSAFAMLLDAQRANRANQEVVDVWIPAAAAAGLQDREAAWQRDILVHGGKLAASELDSFCTLEAARMDNAALAETLDIYARQVSPSKQVDVLSRAVTAWHSAGSVQHEASDVRQLAIVHQQQEYQAKLFGLYLSGNTTALFDLTAGTTPMADAAANYVLAAGTSAQGYEALTHRAATRPPVWGSASMALLGLYYGDTSTKTDAAFQSTLGDLTIGQALATKPNSNKQLSGEPWFYYAGRYGFLLTLAPQPTHDPEDYLPAELERAPSDPASFSAVAKTYFNAKKIDAAIAEYRHAIELDPSDPEPNISIAHVLWSEQRHDEAVVELNSALTKLRDRVDLRAVPESFWTGFAAVATAADEYQIGSQLKPAMTLVLESYIRKNGNYRSSELLDSAFTALSRSNPKGGIEWVLSLVATAPTDDQLTMISELAEEKWVPNDQLGAIYRIEISLAETQAQAKHSEASAEEDNSGDPLTGYKTTYIQWLLSSNRAMDAQSVLSSIPAEQRKDDKLQSLTILLAAKQSRIPALLAGYEGNPQEAADLATISAAANTLSLEHDGANSRLLLEYVFQQRSEQQDLSAPDYLGLAEARIATNDLAGALDVLNRFTLHGDFYANLDSSASLLERTGHFAEAIPLLTKLANGTPWDARYHLRLAKAELDVKQARQSSEVLGAVASSDHAPYATRAEAASALRGGATEPRMSSEELTLLATTTPTPQQASQPYFVYARIAAANAAPPAQRAALLREAIAIAPSNVVDWLRLQLFYAEISLHHDQQASVAIAPILQSDASLFLPKVETPSGEEYATDDSVASVSAVPFDGPYNIAAEFETPQSKVAFLLDLATMDERLHNDQEAVEHLQSAAQLTTDSAEAARLGLGIQTVQGRVEIARQNASRRPVLQPSVEQTNVVEPRLLSGAKSEVHP